MTNYRVQIRQTGQRLLCLLLAFITVIGLSPIIGMETIAVASDDWSLAKSELSPSTHPDFFVNTGQYYRISDAALASSFANNVNGKQDATSQWYGYDTNSWYYPYIKTLVEQGVLFGVDNGGGQYIPTYSKVYTDEFDYDGSVHPSDAFAIALFYYWHGYYFYNDGGKKVVTYGSNDTSRKTVYNKAKDYFFEAIDEELQAIKEYDEELYSDYRSIILSVGGDVTYRFQAFVISALLAQRMSRVKKSPEPYLLVSYSQYEFGKTSIDGKIRNYDPKTKKITVGTEEYSVNGPDQELLKSNYQGAVMQSINLLIDAGVLNGATTKTGRWDGAAIFPQYFIRYNEFYKILVEIKEGFEEGRIEDPSHVHQTSDLNASLSLTGATTKRVNYRDFIFEGDSVSFNIKLDASGTTSKQDITGYKFTFDDGVNATQSKSVTTATYTPTNTSYTASELGYTYADASALGSGDYEEDITIDFEGEVEVTDKLGTTDTATASGTGTITVWNAQPVADFSAYTVSIPAYGSSYFYVGEDIRIADDSEDYEDALANVSYYIYRGSALIGYASDFVVDQTSERYISSFVGYPYADAFNITFAQPGTYKIEAWAVDELGATDTYSTTIYVSPAPEAPVAKINALNSTYLNYSTVFKDASTDANDDIVSRKWHTLEYFDEVLDENGDGTGEGKWIPAVSGTHYSGSLSSGTFNPVDITLQFKEYGTFRLQLTVEDATGKSDTATHTITVLEDIPVIVVNPDPDPGNDDVLYTVTFINTDGTQSTCQVVSGEYITSDKVPGIVDMNGLYEHGWTQDGESLVEPTQIKVTGNLTFAVLTTPIDENTAIHTVTFINTDGTRMVVKVPHNGKINQTDVPDIVDIDGLVELGWIGSTTSSSTVDPTTITISRDMVFWVSTVPEKDTHTVTFINTDGTVATVVVPEGETLDPAEVPDIIDLPKTTENGWTNNGDDIVDPTTVPVDKDMVFWVDKVPDDTTHTVTFVNTDGTVTVIEVEDGQPIPRNEIPDIVDVPGLTENGWTDGKDIVDPEDVIVTDDLVFIVDTDPEEDPEDEHTVTFINTDGTIITIVVPDGETIPEDEVPDIIDLEDVIENGWTEGDGIVDPSTTPITKDIIFWVDTDPEDDDKEETCTVTFINSDGTIVTVEVPVGETVPEDMIPDIVDVPALEEHGWTVDGETVVDPSEVVIEQDMVFHVDVTPVEDDDDDTHTVTFINTDGTVTIIEVPTGEPIPEDKVPDIVDKDDTIENGWTTDGEGIIDPTDIVVDKDIVIWVDTEPEDKTHTVTFINTDGTITVIEVPDGETISEDKVPGIVDEDDKLEYGWTQNGDDVIDPTESPITKDTVFWVKADDISEEEEDTNPNTPYFDNLGRLVVKQNRAAVIDVTKSLSPPSDPIQEGKTEWVLTSVDGYDLKNVKFEGGKATGLRAVFLGKQPGEFKVTITLHNNYSDELAVKYPNSTKLQARTATITVVVVPDEVPEVELYVNNANPDFHTNPTETTVTVASSATSPDGDIIDKYEWSIIRDNNNDGLYKESAIYKETNNTPLVSFPVQFKSGVNGNYLAELKVTETPGQMILSGYVNANEYLSAFTQKEFDVNWVPCISFNFLHNGNEWAYVDDTIVINATLKDEKTSTCEVEWTLKKKVNNRYVAVDPSQCEVWSFRSVGGSIRIPDDGYYVLEAVITDELGYSETFTSNEIRIYDLPTAVISDDATYRWGGRQWQYKQSRRFDIDGGKSYANDSTGEALHQIDHSRDVWYITPISGGAAASAIYVLADDGVSRLASEKAAYFYASKNELDEQLMMIEPGTYRISYQVTNTYGKKSEIVEQIITIIRDNEPIIDIGNPSAQEFLGSSTNNRYVTIGLTNISAKSDDADIVGNTTNYKVQYRYDSDNDGSYDDETWENCTIAADTNSVKTTLQLSATASVNQVGWYQFRIQLNESFGQETLDSIIPDSCYVKKEYYHEVEVINTRPQGTFSASNKVYGDIIFAFGERDTSLGAYTFGANGNTLNAEYGTKTITLQPGRYFLECWGASGGNAYGYTGGKGGYSYGELTLNETTTLTVRVGGRGEDSGGNGSTTYKGGYNGGGSSWYVNAGGGGASDILMNGKRIIVAGGGGGANGYGGDGGAGGGITGESASATGIWPSATEGGGVSSPHGELPMNGGGQENARKGFWSRGYGGYQTAGFLYGSNPNGEEFGMGGGGGGGGGGYEHGRSGGPWDTGGGGGSGYIDSSLSNAATISGLNSFQSPTSDSEETGHDGDGYVRITPRPGLVSYDNSAVQEATLNYANSFGNVEGAEMFQLDVQTVETSSITAETVFPWEVYNLYMTGLGTGDGQFQAVGQDYLYRGYGDEAPIDYLYYDDGKSGSRSFTFSIDMTGYNSCATVIPVFFYGCYMNGNTFEGYAAMMWNNVIGIYKFESPNGKAGLSRDGVGNIATSYARQTVYESNGVTFTLLKAVSTASSSLQKSITMNYSGDVLTIIDSTTEICAYECPSVGNGYGVGAANSGHGCGARSYTKFKNFSLVTDSSKALSESLSDVSFNSDHDVFVIWSEAAIPQELDVTSPTYKEDFAELLALLMSQNVHLIVLGSVYNQEVMENLLSQMNVPCKFINEGSLSADLAASREFIASILRKGRDDEVKYVLINEETVYTKYYDDYNGHPHWYAGGGTTDTIASSRWMYIHEPDYYLNSLGTLAEDGLWLANEKTMFSQTGRYYVDYRVMDNSVPDAYLDDNSSDNPFHEYRLWSNNYANDEYTIDDELSNPYAEIYVHRRPIADYSFVAHLSSTAELTGIDITESAYDLDHYEVGNDRSRDDKGLQMFEWTWQLAENPDTKATQTFMDAASGEKWINEQLAGIDYNSETNVIISYRVRDIDGEESSQERSYRTAIIGTVYAAPSSYRHTKLDEAIVVNGRTVAAKGTYVTTSYEEAISELVAKADAAEATYNEKKADYDAKNAEALAKEAEAAAAEDERDAQGTVVQSIEDDIADVTAVLDAENEILTQYASELELAKENTLALIIAHEAALSEYDALIADYDAQVAELETLNGELATLNEELTALREIDTSEMTDEELEAHNQAIVDKEAEIADMETTIEAKSAEISSTALNCDEKLAEVNELSVKVEVAKTSEIEAQERHDAQAEAVSELEAEKAELEDALEAAADKYNPLADAATEARTAATTAKSAANTAKTAMNTAKTTWDNAEKAVSNVKPLATNANVWATRKETVTVYDGVWSNYNTVRVSGNPLPPVAKFQTNKIYYDLNEPVQITDMSYSPNGNNIAVWDWTITGGVNDIVDNISYTVGKKDETHLVSFVNGNGTVSTVSVDNGTRLTSAQVPTIIGGTGWTTNGTNTVTPTSVTITANTVFWAKRNNTSSHMVLFIGTDNTVTAVSVANGGKVSAENIPSLGYVPDNALSSGWTNGGTDYVSPEQITIYRDTVFAAKYSTPTLGSSVLFINTDGSTFVANEMNPIAPDIIDIAGVNELGWTKDDIETIDPYMIDYSQDQVIFVKTENETITVYDVAFINADGAITTAEVVSGGSVSADKVPAIAEVEGKTVDGWYLNGDSERIDDPSTVAIYENAVFYVKTALKEPEVTEPETPEPETPEEPIDPETPEEEIPEEEIPEEETPTDPSEGEGGTGEETGSDGTTEGEDVVEPTKYTITFVNADNTVTQIETTAEAGITTDSIPVIASVEHYTISGWTTDNVTVINDLAAIKVESDMVFWVMKERIPRDMYTVYYLNTDNTVTMEYVYEGDKPKTVPTIVDDAMKIEHGWTIDGTTHIDPSSIEITRNTLFKVDAEDIIASYVVAFINTNGTVTNLTISDGDKIPADMVPDIIDVAGITERGWRLNDTAAGINPADYTVNRDLVFWVDTTTNGVNKVHTVIFVNSDYTATTLLIPHGWNITSKQVPKMVDIAGVVESGWTQDGKTDIIPTATPVTKDMIFWVHSIFGTSVLDAREMEKLFGDYLTELINAQPLGMTNEENTYKITLNVTDDKSVPKSSEVPYSVSITLVPNNTAPNITPNEPDKNDDGIGDNNTSIYRRDPLLVYEYDAYDANQNNPFYTYQGKAQKRGTETLDWSLVIEDPDNGDAYGEANDSETFTIDYMFERFTRHDASTVTDEMATLEIYEYLGYEVTEAEALVNSKVAPFTTVRAGNLAWGAYRITTTVTDHPNNGSAGKPAAIVTKPDMPPKHLYVIPKLDVSNIHYIWDGLIDTDEQIPVGDTITVTLVTNGQTSGVNILLPDGEGGTVTTTATVASTNTDGTKNWTADVTIPSTIEDDDLVDSIKYTFKIETWTDYGMTDGTVTRTKSTDKTINVLAMKLFDFRVTGIADPSVEYDGDPVYVPHLAFDETNTTSETLIKKGYAFDFEISSVGLAGDENAVRIRPTFYAYNAATGKYDIELDLYYRNADDEYVLATYSPDLANDPADTFVINQTGKNGSVLGSIRELILDADDRTLINREQVWSGSYGVPSTAVFVVKGGALMASNVISEDVVVSFDIHGLKNGEAKCSYIESGQWASERVNTNGYLIDPNKAKYNDGAVILIDSRKSINDNYQSRPVWRKS